jgi:hypothetical protein
MRKYVIIPMLLICFSAFADPVQPVDSATQKKLDDLTKTVTSIKEKTDVLLKQVPTTQAQQTSTATPTVVLNNHLSFQQALIITSPTLLSILFMVYCIVRLRKEGFKLSDALAGDCPVSREIENPKYDPQNVKAAPATITVVDYPKSSSRLIAFFSGLAAIVISVTTVTYFFYMYFRTGQTPDLDKMSTIILSLGIGITPYALNKFSSAVSK